MTELAGLIKAAYARNGVITTYVYGDFGYGKTSYALWTAYEVLGNWDRVLNYLFFGPKEALEVIGKAVYSGKRLPIIILDDAELWLGKLTWWEEDKVAFHEILQLNKVGSCGANIHAPIDDLPKSIRKKTFFRIEVNPASIDEVRKAYEINGALSDFGEFLKELK